MYDDDNNKKYTIHTEPGCGMPIAFILGSAALLAWLVFLIIIMAEN